MTILRYKYIIGLCLSVTMASTGNAQEKNAHTQADIAEVADIMGSLPLNTARAKLNGKIQSYKETVFSVSDTTGKVVKTPDFTTTFKFNEKGNLLEAEFRNPDGKIGGKCAFKYDYRDSMTEANLFFAKGGLRSYRVLYKYDSVGNKTDFLYKPFPKLHWLIVHKYNQQKLEVATVSTSLPDSIVLKTEMKYDNEGHIIEMQTFNKEGKQEYTLTYKYNGNGELIEQCSYTGKNTLTLKTTSETKTTANGKEVSSTSYIDKNRVSGKEKKRYDDKGNETQTVFNEYNFEGKPSPEQPHVNSYQYKYDTKGNMIEKTEFSNNDLSISITGTKTMSDKKVTDKEKMVRFRTWEYVYY